MEKFDHLYVSITQEVGGIEGLFNSLFSFLLRRTDFFYESNPGDNMGFPPGVNEQMLLKIFNSFRELHYKNNPKKSVEEYAKKYVKYAKENGLPLPKGVESGGQGSSQKKEVKNVKKSQAKSESKPVEKKAQEVAPKKKESEKQVVENKDIKKESKPQSSMFNDIRY
jgi:hypothetical protein